MMRKMLAAMFAGAMIFGGVACDDNENSGRQESTKTTPGSARATAKTRPVPAGNRT